MHLLTKDRRVEVEAEMSADLPLDYRLTIEGLVEFTAAFNRGLVHGLHVTCYAQFPIRRFDTASVCFHSV